MIRNEAFADATHVCDLCIVGAGPVGISLALELAALGHDVLLLESGGNEAGGEAQSLSEAELVDPRRHDSMRIAVARRLGGTSTLWGGRCAPYDPLDFEPRPVVPAPTWPIGAEDIAPFLPRACRYAHCGEPVFERPLPELPLADDRFSLTALERWSAQPRFQKAYGRQLAASRAIDVRLNTTVVGFRLGGGGQVDALDVAHADGTRTTIVAKDVILCAGGVETTRLLLTLQRQRPDALGGADGPLGRYYMGHVIGEIADLEVGSDVLDRELDFFLDGHGSFARRRFVPSPAEQREHALCNVAFWPVVPPVADPRHGSGALSLITLALSVEIGGRRLLPEAIWRRHTSEDTALAPHLANVSRDMAGVAGFMPRLLWQRYGPGIRHPGLYLRNRQRRYGLSYHAEHLPHPDSRVRLTDTSDRMGMPRVSIDLRFAQEDGEAVVRAHERLGAWLAANRLGSIHYRQPEAENVRAVLDIASHGTHQIGLARMAGSPRDGVVDANLTAFGVPNLHVASSAVLPTSSQANPTLTTIALALRLAEHLSNAR